MKTYSLLSDKKDSELTVLSSTKVAEPKTVLTKKSVAMEQIRKALKLQLKGIYLF